MQIGIFYYDSADAIRYKLVKLDRVVTSMMQLMNLKQNDVIFVVGSTGGTRTVDILCSNLQLVRLLLLHWLMVHKQNGMGGYLHSPISSIRIKYG